ncbi:DNA repair protein RecN [Sulfitobacter mediterraneus]|uniref:DNA repair protein RecN n=1 Tax=Sulfitobacter mediterraneus TaxID=83219 RepID=UPI001932396B|nr:DNA repair protein RecN [Sulfitobacter mediterraneus]MBM1632474.1 DNA repair protein RecN [Sulfitobacter mediterraneus]MBM1640291.1 DNA repair protein RecN [Sulfitobacter mediterraneus]MBM1644339.1 DNA repair protein RecN [Sulfitobacter mediterraneus]MBM1648386.1 DNA repair protein RecN [Sulfitobacter mediterraneus]MBM1652431.1 DNA repair protein RecN [Sulfitobacter mediterraneus]
MLRGLDISDMLIIDRLELGFQPGLNVLTGETGAGKSILLDSLGFVLGWRGRADLVRQGAEQGEVTAWFDLAEGHPARAVLQEAGLPDGDELILRRINGRDGRKTAWVNDRRCSGEVLRALSETLVELHGQHDDRGLLNPRGHRAILDDFAGNGAAQINVRKAWSALAAARKAAKIAADEREAIEAEEEFLRHAVAELDKLDPQEGEEATLDTKRRMMQGAEKIRSDVVNAYEMMGQNGAERQLGDALRWLDGAAAQAEGALEAPMAALNRAMMELDEAMSGVADAIDAMSFNPIELEEAEERLFAIRGLARKHDVAPDDLAGFADTLRAKLDALDAGEAAQAALEQAVRDAEAAYEAAAEALSRSRAKAAAKLDKAVAAELAPLKMERAVFETQITAEDPGPDGRDGVSFTVATNPGAPAGPLGKIASGGELSRFLLALKVCLTQGQSGLTLIFDEIDRGVGGATADAVGRRLSALAEGGQVLVVTHSPQVAALGAHHWRVAKGVAKGITTSTVVPLTPADRVDEVARMLSGDVITDAARAAAEALLAG